MKKKKKMISVFAILLLSFFIVFFVPLALNILFYSNTYTLLERFLYKYNTFLLNQLESKIYEEVVKPLETIKKSINANPFYTDFILPSENISKEDIYLDYKVFSRELTSFLTYPFIEDVFIYIPKNDMIVGPSFFESSRLYYDYICKPKKLSFENWYSFLNHSYSNKFISSFSVEINRRPENILLFVHTLENWSFGDKNANLLVFLNTDKLSEFLAELLINKRGSIFVLDSDSNIILSYTTDKKLFTYFLNISKINYQKEGFKNLVLDNENYIMYYSVSANNGWKYMYFVPSNEFLNYLEKVKFSIIVVILLSLLIGGFLIWYLSVRNYKPIMELKNALLTHSFSRSSSSEYLEKMAGNSEYSLLQSLTNVMLDQGASLKKQVLNLENIMNNTFTVHFLKGDAENISYVEKYINGSSKPPISNLFALVLIEIEEYYRIDEKKMDEDLTQFIILNVLSELFERAGFIAYSVIFSKRQLGLILNVDENSKSESDIRDILIDGKNYLQSNFSIFFTAGISRIKHGISNLRQCYKEADQALKLKFVYGNVSVYLYDQISQSMKNDILYYFPPDIENALVNFVMGGYSDKVENLLNSLFAHNLEKFQLPFSMLKLFANHLFSVYTKIYEVVKHNKKSEIDQISELLNYQNINDQEELISFLNMLKDRFMDMTESVNKLSLTFNSKLVSKVLRYVEENFSDPNISLTLIADRFNITPQYLSVLFKEKTGSNLSDFILQLRINRAKELLINTDHTINKISQELGYTHVSSFIKVFKKIEGVSPAQYRSIHKQGS